MGMGKVGMWEGIPILIPKKIHHINRLQHLHHHHLPAHLSVPLDLPRRPRRIYQRPAYNPGPSIMEKLQIPVLPNPGVQLHPSEKIKHPGPAELAVGRVGWEEVAFQVRECAEEQAVDVRCDEEGGPVCGDQGWVDEVVIGSGEEEDVRYRPGEQAVRGVFQTIPTGRHLAGGAGAGEEGVQQCLEEQPCGVACESREGRFGEVVDEEPYGRLRGCFLEGEEQTAVVVL